MFKLWNDALIDPNEVVALSIENRSVGSAWGYHHQLSLVLTLRGGASVEHRLPNETITRIEYRPAQKKWWGRFFSDGGEMVAHEVKEPNPCFADAEVSMNALREILCNR